MGLRHGRRAGRRVPAHRRIVAAVTAAAATATGVIAALAPPAHAAFPGTNGLVAFATNRHGAGNHEIYAVNEDGSGLTNLTAHANNDFHPAWSADGSRVAFVSDRSGSGLDVYVMDADGTNVARVGWTTSSDHSPAWSPDGSKIAFATNADGQYEIYVVNADGTGLTRLTNNPAPDQSPAWSPDGSRIAFETKRDGNWEVYVMNADGSGQTNITNHIANDAAPFNSHDGAPSWSPDGHWIAFTSNRDGNHEIYVSSSDGTAPTRLTNSGGVDFAPAFSPDGSRIAFQTNRDGNWEVYVMHADGSWPTNLTNSPALENAPDWQPIPLRRLDVTVAGMGAGVVTSDPAGIDCGADCSELFTSGTTVTLTATADVGSTFAGWSGDCSGSESTCVVEMTAARSVTATFDLVPTAWILSVLPVGTGSGTVTSRPGGITCGDTCSASFAPGTTVELKARQAPRSRFVGWTGCDVVQGRRCMVTLQSHREVHVQFDAR